MSDLDLARKMLTAAGKDLKALRGLAKPECYQAEIFGFHAQEAVEKTLKAWLALRNVSFPKTHSLRYLLDLSKQSGCDVEHRWDFLELQPFAVQFRYDAYDAIEPTLDADDICDRVAKFVAEIEKLFAEFSE